VINFNKKIKKIQYGAHEITLETGELARQASAAVLVRMEDTVVLVTAVGKKSSTPRDFFPLTVNYQEKTYAIGKIPGGYFKREGRPTEKETLVSRLIDRPLRPLFPKGFTDEVQVIATVLSMDPNVSTDVPAMIGASAALALSGMPFQGPIGAARVGFSDGHYILNPSMAELADSKLDLVVAGTRDAVLMVESEADQLTETEMLGAVMFGHEQMQVVINAILELAAEVGVSDWGWQPPKANTELMTAIEQKCEAQLREAYQIKQKAERQLRIAAIRQELLDQLCSEESKAAGGPSEAEVQATFHSLESKLVRSQILAGEPRIDGRDTETVRPIHVEVGKLPRTHGSAVFTRGETQVLAVATLGTERDAQLIDDLDGDRRDEFMLHYNFPPFCVGEAGMMMGPKRREVGHGKLAKRAMMAVIPDLTEFPYVLRIVAEVLESNGSSSMATVCSSSLALMDAGVPLKAPVAGIAMGLIKGEDSFAVLTDILGDEDHLGDMDFKVAGTEAGITALQMDIKITGITREIMQVALDQARAARLHILKIMNNALSEHRLEVSAFAPRIITFKINPDKIRDVIGKGGATIREITETTGTTIDISDDGVIKIAAVDQDQGAEARRRIEELTTELEIGHIYDGQVVKLMDYGAFVAVMPGQQGLVHISQITEERVENIHDYLQEGQAVRVKVTEIDRQGRVRLSMKDL